MRIFGANEVGGAKATAGGLIALTFLLHLATTFVSAADFTTNGTTHWSLQPLLRPALPNAEPHPIDAFIKEKLAAQKLKLSPPADRRTLIRRAYYDLTGLPPSPGVVDAFLSAEDPRAWEKLVTRLLASPRYGERWARHWLDAVHYADTHGNDHDYARPNCLAVSRLCHCFV